MSKKTLLNENTVRQFMKYANIGGLSDKFINENYMAEDEHEKEVEEGMYYEEEHDGEVEEGVVGTLGGAKAGMMAGGAIGGPIGAAVGGLGGAVLGDKATGDGIMEEEPGMEDMGDDMEMDDSDMEMDDSDMEMGAGDPMDDMEMDDGDMMEMLDDEEVVQETMKRVMKRLRVMKEGKRTRAKKSQMIDSVADAIVARLRKKK